jgi:hypothetical protein
VSDILILSSTNTELEVRSSFAIVQARDEQNETRFVRRRIDRLTIDGKHCA